MTSRMAPQTSISHLEKRWETPYDDVDVHRGAHIVRQTSVASLLTLSETQTTFPAATRCKSNSILMRSVFNEPETASLVDLTHLHQ